MHRMTECSPPPALQAQKEALEAKLIAEWNDKIKRLEDIKEGKYVPDGEFQATGFPLAPRSASISSTQFVIQHQSA